MFTETPLLVRIVHLSDNTPYLGHKVQLVNVEANNRCSWQAREGQQIIRILKCTTCGVVLQ
jgi:hypothetical protein